MRRRPRAKVVFMRKMYLYTPFYSVLIAIFSFGKFEQIEWGWAEKTDFLPRFGAKIRVRCHKLGLCFKKVGTC